MNTSSSCASLNEVRLAPWACRCSATRKPSSSVLSSSDSFCSAINARICSLLRAVGAIGLRSISRPALRIEPETGYALCAADAGCLPGSRRLRCAPKSRATASPR